MKKIVLSLVTVFIVVLSSLIISFAHSGKTDANGGHYDHETDEYHYHHGYSAHLHPNGKCPYNYNDKTGESSGSDSSSSDYSGSTKNYPSHSRSPEELAELQRIENEKIMRAKWIGFGKTDGAKQKRYETVFNIYYEKCFFAQVDFYKLYHPVFSYLYEKDSEHFFYFEPFDFSYKYQTNLDIHYINIKPADEDYDYYDWYSEGYKTGYDSVYKALSDAEFEDAMAAGKEAGRKAFEDPYLFAYKQEHPVESLFTLAASDELPLVIISMIILLICVVFVIFAALKIIKKSRSKRIIVPTESTSTSEESTEPKPLQQPPSEEKANETSAPSPAAPEPSEAEPTYDYNGKELLRVGIDIPQGSSCFSPNDNNPAFIRVSTESKKNEYDLLIYQDKQYVYLMNGETVRLINCTYVQNNK